MTTPEAIDLSGTVAPNSDQIGGDDLLPGPRTVTITKVSLRSDEKQPTDIHLAEFDRPFRPCLTMRRVLMRAWGTDGKAYVGRRMTLYRDPNVKFGGDALGGVRISHLSHIDKPVDDMFKESKGKYKRIRVEPLKDAAPAPTPKQPPTAAAIIAAFDALGVTVEQLEARIGSAHDKWTGEDIASLAALGKALKAGETTTFEEFETAAAEPEQGELGVAAE